MVLSITIHIIDDEVDKREITSFNGTGLVLMRIGNANSIVQTALKETGVKFTGYRGIVLLLIVTCILVIERIHRGDIGGRETGIAEAGSRGGRSGTILAVDHIVTDIHLVVLVDIPIDTTKEFDGRSLEVVAGIGAGLITELVFEILADRIKDDRGRIAITVDTGREDLATVIKKPVRADSTLGKLTGRTRLDRRILLDAEEQEKLILDDRSAYRSAVHKITGIDLVIRIAIRCI